MSVGTNQNGVLDTRASTLEGDLIGMIAKSDVIEEGKKVYIVFNYEKNNQTIEEEIEVMLQKE